MTDKTKEAPARSALKLALEALESWGKGFPDNWGDLDTEAITAIREALAEESSGTEQPAQPQQEPVAIGWYIEGFSCVLGLIRPEVRYEEWRPFYALRKPPAQRTWVGLTDEEISKMPAWIYSPDQDGMTAEEGLEVFARAIEAKLKEKNR